MPSSTNNQDLRPSDTTVIRQGFSHLHEKDSVEYHERFRQGAGDVSVLVETKHPGPGGHGHGLDVLHVATVRIFVVVVDTRVDSVLVERVVRVKHLVQIALVKVYCRVDSRVKLNCRLPFWLGRAASTSKL